MQVTPTVGPGSIHQPSINHIGTQIFKSENWILAPLLLLLGWWWWRGVSPVFMFPGPGLHPHSSPHNHKCTVLYCTVPPGPHPHPHLSITTEFRLQSSPPISYFDISSGNASILPRDYDSLIDSDEALFVHCSPISVSHCTAKE